MKWSESGEGNKSFEDAPLGVHTARVVKILDLGTRKREWQGSVKLRRECMIGFELPSCLMSDGRPFVVSRFFTSSLAETSHLRPFLENMRGKAFTEDELKGFDAKRVLGALCLISIIDHNGKRRIGAAMSMPKDMPKPPQVNPSVSLSLERDEFDPAVFNALSDRMKAMIAESPEYKELQSVPGSETVELHPDKLDDDIPF